MRVRAFASIVRAAEDIVGRWLETDNYAMGVTD